jgi:hypothetical protein
MDWLALVRTRAFLSLLYERPLPSWFNEKNSSTIASKRMCYVIAKAEQATNTPAAVYLCADSQLPSLATLLPLPSTTTNTVNTASQ